MLASNDRPTPIVSCTNNGQVKGRWLATPLIRHPPPGLAPERERERERERARERERKRDDARRRRVAEDDADSERGMTDKNCSF